MAIISSFLCWSNTRIGSAVCGYYTLVISVVCLSFYILRYIAQDDMKDSLELKGIVYAGFVLYSFLICVSLILLPGVYMDRKLLLQPWIYVLVITVLYETGAIALITTVHLEQDHSLDVWEIVAVAFYCVRLIFNCYCFACVVSQYQELSEGRGTYEYLYKPRRRHQVRARGSDPLTDLDEYNPPYGASLPPYSEDNPYKEYSPPTYENLAIDYRMLDAVNPCHYSLRGRRLDSPDVPAMSGSYVANVEVNTPPRGLEDCRLLQLDSGRYSPWPSETSFERASLTEENVALERELGSDRHGLGDVNLDFDEIDVCKCTIDNRRERSRSSDRLDCQECSQRSGSCPKHEIQEDPSSHLPRHHRHNHRDHRHYHHHRHPSRESHHSTSSRFSGASPSRLAAPSSRHCRASSAEVSSVAMTSSSACLLGNEANTLPRVSQGHQGSRHKHKTRSISPLTIQKRTYITWI